MSKESTSNGAGGCSFLFTALFITFLVLKLIGKIDWSWWWVTAPLWIPTGLGLTIAIPCIIIILVRRNK